MPDFLTINVQAQIAFALMMIAAILVYLAFFKDSGGKGRHGNEAPHHRTP